MKPEVLPRCLDVKMRSFHFIQIQLGAIAEFYGPYFSHFLSFLFSVTCISILLQPYTDAVSSWTLSSFQTAFQPKSSPQPELPVSLLLLNSYLIFSRVSTTWLLYTHTVRSFFSILISPYEPGLCRE